jgi:hypothetical protein
MLVLVMLVELMELMELLATRASNPITSIPAPGAQRKSNFTKPVRAY